MLDYSFFSICGLILYLVWNSAQNTSNQLHVAFLWSDCKSFIHYMHCVAYFWEKKEGLNRTAYSHCVTVPNFLPKQCHYPLAQFTHTSPTKYEYLLHKGNRCHLCHCNCSILACLPSCNAPKYKIKR